MTAIPRTQRIADHLIRRACRRLPGEAGDERYREWAAELPAILSDPDIGSGLRRSARALRYGAGVSRCARRLGRAGGRPEPQPGLPAPFPGRARPYPPGLGRFLRLPACATTLNI